MDLGCEGGGAGLLGSEGFLGASEVGFETRRLLPGLSQLRVQPLVARPILKSTPPAYRWRQCRVLSAHPGPRCRLQGSQLSRELRVLPDEALILLPNLKLANSAVCMRKPKS